MFYQKNNLLFMFLLLITLSPSSYATKQQILDIKAQYLLLNEKKGISQYKGNVLLTKNTLTIKADTVTLFYKNKKLTKALITGSPADLQHQPDNEAKVHSQANKMEFYVNEDRLVLKGNAFVDQGNRHFSGENIEYDTRQRIITAAGAQNKLTNTNSSKNTPPSNRVHVIIGPAENADNTAENSNTK